MYKYLYIANTNIYVLVVGQIFMFVKFLFIKKIRKQLVNIEMIKYIILYLYKGI